MDQLTSCAPIWLYVHWQPFLLIQVVFTPHLASTFSQGHLQQQFACYLLYQNPQRDSSRPRFMIGGEGGMCMSVCLIHTSAMLWAIFRAELYAGILVRSSYKNCVHQYSDVRHNIRATWTVCQKQRCIYVTCDFFFGLKPIFLVQCSCLIVWCNHNIVCHAEIWELLIYSKTYGIPIKGIK